MGAGVIWALSDDMAPGVMMGGGGGNVL
jgi:hypothetical protein